MTESPANLPVPRYGEIWLIDLNPTKGSEIQKRRPALIVSVNGLGVLPVKLISPITEWKSHFEYNLWHVKIEPDKNNGLAKTSTIDVLQLRAIDYKARCIKRLGFVNDEMMSEVAAAIAMVTGYQIPHS